MIPSEPSLPPQVTPDSENDFGNYNCTAVNRIGQESSEFILVQAGEQGGQPGWVTQGPCSAASCQPLLPSEGLFTHCLLP